MRNYDWGEQPLKQITVGSRHLEDYTLVNRADGSVWNAELGDDGEFHFHRSADHFVLRLGHPMVAVQVPLR